MIKRLQSLGKYGVEALSALGRASMMLANTFFTIPAWGNAIKLLIRQLHSVGVLSLVIILLSGIAVGAVLALQFYYQLVRFSAESALGLGVAIAMLTELGPVITGLLFAGRAGSALTAEIGLMKATEQLAMMEMIGVDPLHRVVGPRLWAGFIALPLLALMFSSVGILSSAVVGIDWLGVSEGAFWVGMQEGIYFEKEVMTGIIKTLVFGFVVTWIAVFQGYDCIPTSEGIGRATTYTVVYSSIAILVLDFVLTIVLFEGF